MSKKVKISKNTIKSLLNIDEKTFNNFSEKELKKQVLKLASAANKRIKRLNQSNYITPALDKVNRSGGRFFVQGKNLSDLKLEFQRVSEFLKNKTSTVKGWKKVLKGTNEYLKKMFPNQNLNFTEKGLENFVRLYERLKELDPRTAQRKFQYITRRMIYDEIGDEDINIDEIAEELAVKIREIYEKEETESSNLSASKYFQ